MKNENKDLSRRKFLATGAAAAAATSIIAIKATAAPDSEELMNSAKNEANPSPFFFGDPVTTTGVQTLTNKTIPSRQNILGTDYVNVREYLASGTDITNALNSAISYLSSSGSLGGQILIPHGIWTSNGGHELGNSISIEGVGFSDGHYINYGTEIQMNSNSSSTYMFRISADRWTCSLKNLGINLLNKPTATGLLMTNPSTGKIIYNTYLEAVTFLGGAYGIKVDSVGESDPECILNSFERLSFLGCQTAFYCDSINSGFKFDNCYFSLPSDTEKQEGGTALECVYIGNLSVEHCLFVGTSTPVPNVPISDGSTILKTVSAFNNISFYDCQDENVEFMYQNANNNFEYAAIVYRNCLIQSKLHFTASGAVAFDSCVLGDSGGGVVTDTSTAYVWVFLKGLNNCFTPTGPTGGNIGNFVNNYSKIVYEGNKIGEPVITPLTSPGDITAYGTRGTVVAGSGTGYVTVYCYYVKASSLVFAQLRTFDSGGAAIRNVECGAGFFTIHLTKNAAANLSISYMIEN